MTRAADALAIARGDVRDGIASIEHFLNVLTSRRVGPRVLARGIPEVRAGCEPLRTALSSLAGAVAVELARDPEGVDATAALLAHARGLVDQLDAAIQAAEGKSLDARERLGLESDVRRAAGDLGTVLHLADLLGAPVTSETTTIDLDDALAQRRAHPRSGATAVLTAFDVRVSELTVGDARLVLDLLELAVATVVRAGVVAPRIVIALGPERFPVFTVDAVPGQAKDGSGGDGQVLDVVLRAELPREADVIRAAARHAGIALTVAADRRTVTLAL